MKLKVLFLALCLVPVVLSKARRYTRLMTEPLSRTKCDLVCLEVEKVNKTACRTQCKDKEVKPGTCPASDSPLWAEACVEACNRDSQCDGTQRCCRHGCGSTCSEPTDLLTLPGLPARPVISDPKERRRSITIKWSDGVGDLARAVPGRILYILEEQYQLGPKYEEARLGVWSMLLRTNKTQVSLRNLLKPGRWYRFRVAAVSAAGTRGYSAPSTPFIPRRGPRPPPQPKRLKVSPLATNNGTIAVRLQWKEPRSDLPVLRYKVYWSRRVRGIQSDLDSVVVNHQTIAKEQTHYDITDLQPNSMYFLQVQTISQYGLGKLRSDKAEIFYNTTNINDHPQELVQKSVKKIRGLKLQRVVWNNHRIRARVSWDPLPNIDGRARRYFVHWETVSCFNKPQKIKKELSASTEESTFEIYELEYGCNYKVHVNKSPQAKTRQKHDSELFVTIPNCKNFQRRLNGTKINCDRDN